MMSNKSQTNIPIYHEAGAGDNNNIPNIHYIQQERNIAYDIPMNIHTPCDTSNGETN